MKTRILLVSDNSEECAEAKQILVDAQIPFDELLAHPVWSEIEFPIPSFLTDKGNFLGLEEIKLVPGVLGYDEPN